MTTTSSLQQDVAENIRELLRWSNRSQKDLASFMRKRGIDFAEAGLSRRLNGHMDLSLPETEVIADFIGVDVRVLYKTPAELLMWVKESDWLDLVRSRCDALGGRRRHPGEVELPFPADVDLPEYALAILAREDSALDVRDDDCPRVLVAVG